MTLEEYAYVAQIIGVVLVVASLVYVARQLQQNTEMLRSGSRQVLVGNDHAVAQMWMANADLMELISKPDSLSFRDQVRFSLLMITEMRNREHEFLQKTAGTLDEETWLAYREIIRVSLGNERGQKWWNGLGKAFYAPRFCKMVDEMIAETPQADLRSRLGSWE